MHQSFVTPAPPHLRGGGWAGDSGANVWGSPAVPGKWRACYIIPRGIYSYKEQGYDSQQDPAVQGF